MSSRHRLDALESIARRHSMTCTTCGQGDQQAPEVTAFRRGEEVRRCHRVKGVPDTPLSTYCWPDRTHFGACNAESPPAIQNRLHPQRAVPTSTIALLGS